MVVSTHLSERTYAYWCASQWLAGHGDPTPIRIQIAHGGLRDMAQDTGRLAAAAWRTLRLRGLGGSVLNFPRPPGGSAA